MKLLFDQNISHRLVATCQHSFPDSRHVKDFNLQEADDTVIWTFAAENGFALVSKDSDFLHRSLLRGHPPKAIYLRIGNCPTARNGCYYRVRH